MRAAVDLFSRLGPSNVGMRRVAERAEVSLGLIHYHFESKKGLLESSLEFIEGPLLDLEPEHLDRVRAGEDLGDVMTEAYLDAFGRIRDQRALMRIILILVGQGGGLPRRWREGSLHAFLERWTEAIVEQTDADPTEVRFRLHNVLALTTRYIASSEAELRTVLGRPDASLDQVRDHLVAQVRAMADRWVAAAPRGD